MLMTRALLFLAFLLPASDPVVDSIVKEERDHSRVMDYLDHLVNKIGPRLTSSTRLTEACEWTRGEFEKMGLKARLEEWGTYPVGFDRGPWSAKMISPESLDLTIGFNAWSAGTSGPVTGPAVLAPETDEELLAVKEKLKGAWVISTTRGPEKYRVAYDEAKIAGIVRATRGDLILTGGDYQVDWDKLPTAPTINSGKAQFDEIAAGSRRQAGHARIRHPQLFQEGPDQALQRDRRHPGHRETRRIRDRRRPHRLVGRRHRRDRQRHRRRHHPGGRPNPDEGRA